MSEILDSGSRRQFESGAVRDIVEGKGRCDLLPLDIVAKVIEPYNAVVSEIIFELYQYMQSKDEVHLYKALWAFIDDYSNDVLDSVLDVSKHYEQGCKKYGERNWEKGIPIHCYIDSGVRHLLKYYLGYDDEPHGRAFIWNTLGAVWTHTHIPELVDIP